MIIDEIVFRGLLAKGEHIDFVAHVHPFVIYPKLFKVLIVGTLMPLGGYFLFPPFKLVWAIWAGLGALLFAYRLMQWYLDAWIITNHAVIDQEWNTIFDKSTTRIEYGNVEGISNEIKGFWGTILRFGNIQIEHMSGQPITLEHVSNPRKVERHIINNQQTFMRRQNFEDHGKLQDLLVNLLRSGAKRG